MTNKTRLAAILMALSCAHCGAAEGSDSTSSNSSFDDSASGATADDMSGGDAQGDGMTAAGGGASDGADAGDGMGSEADAGAPAETITGTEAECVAAFTRIATCYLSQEKCVDTAVANAETLGAGLSATNCADLSSKAGGLDVFAAQYNADTDCMSTDITAFYPSLNGNAQIKDLCESAPLTAEECKTSCTQIVPCASGIADMQAADALSDQANCEANCTMQPILSPTFRCALNAGSDCAAVQACFNE